MTQKNSLMEWLEQTRRISKSVDIICCETIDGVIDIALPYLSRQFIYKNKEFFDQFCSYYNKDHPVDLYRKRKKLYTSRENLKVLTNFVQGSIDRCWKGIEMARTAWMEVVDFLWIRPELVNTAILDDYIRTRIQEVCSLKNKKNPLNNGMWEHFGRHWIDENGEYREERRKTNR